MYPMLYRAWLKYRFAHNSIEEEDSRYREIIYSLIGMGEEFRGDGALAGRMLRYAGIISQRPRTLVGLKTILNDSFSDLQIDIEPCVPRYVNVPAHQKCRLGHSNNRIGEEAVIGQEVCDRASKYLIRIGPLDNTGFNGLINDESAVTFIKAVAKLFLIHPLQYEIELILEPGTARPVELGVPDHASLGRNTWLVSETNAESYRLLHA
jgi:type VI secretion system protein ImpH